MLPIPFGVFLFGLDEWVSRQKAPHERKIEHGSKVSGWKFSVLTAFLEILLAQSAYYLIYAGCTSLFYHQ